MYSHVYWVTQQNRLLSFEILSKLTPNSYKLSNLLVLISNLCLGTVHLPNAHFLLHVWRSVSCFLEICPLCPLYKLSPERLPYFDCRRHNKGFMYINISIYVYPTKTRNRQLIPMLLEAIPRIYFVYLHTPIITGEQWPGNEHHQMVLTYQSLWCQPSRGRCAVPPDSGYHHQSDTNISLYTIQVSLQYLDHQWCLCATEPDVWRSWRDKYSQVTDL